MTRWSGFEFPANDAYDVRPREDRSPIGGACSDEVYCRFGPNRIESTKVLMRGHDRERRRVCDTLIHGDVASKEVSLVALVAALAERGWNATQRWREARPATAELEPPTTAGTRRGGSGGLATAEL